MTFYLTIDDLTCVEELVEVSVEVRNRTACKSLNARPSLPGAILDIVPIDSDARPGDTPDFHVASRFDTANVAQLQTFCLQIYDNNLHNRLA